MKDHIMPSHVEVKRSELEKMNRLDLWSAAMGKRGEEAALCILATEVYAKKFCNAETCKGRRQYYGEALCDASISGEETMEQVDEFFIKMRWE
jgi:hypothetical protein